MNSDIKHIGFVFPNEVWMMILSEVKGVKDHHQIIWAFPHFESYFRKERIKILFVSVAKILHQKSKSYLSKAECIKVLLKCRKVCSGWKNGVDSLFQETTYKTLQHSQLISTYYLTGSLTGTEYFTFPSDFRKFNKHFELTHLEKRRNPLPFRNVTIKLVGSTDSRVASASLEYLKELVATFSDYGNHVRFLSIDYSGAATKLEVGQTFRSVLLHLPNLKALKVKYTVQDLDFRNPNDQAALEKFIDMNPMPTLQKLERFQCSGALPLKIIESVLNGTPKLTYVELIVAGFMAWDFLLPVANSLRYLSLLLTVNLAHYPSQELDRLDKTIQFYKNLENLKKSNIWEIFPALQVIQCALLCEIQFNRRSYRCTRKEWKQCKEIM